MSIEYGYRNTEHPRNQLPCIMSVPGVIFQVTPAAGGGTTTDPELVGGLNSVYRANLPDGRSLYKRSGGGAALVVGRFGARSDVFYGWSTSL